MSDWRNKGRTDDPLVICSPDLARESLAIKDRQVFDAVFLLMNERIEELVARVNESGGKLKTITITWRNIPEGYAPDADIGYFEIKAIKQ